MESGSVPSIIFAYVLLMKLADLQLYGACPDDLQGYQIANDDYVGLIGLLACRDRCSSSTRGLLVDREQCRTSVVTHRIIAHSLVRFRSGLRSSASSSFSAMRFLSGSTASWSSRWSFHYTQATMSANADGGHLTRFASLKIMSV